MTQCLKSKPGDQRSALFFFFFSRHAEPPQVTVELQQQEVVHGSTVRFTCDARGKPTPSVMWLHNARPLSPSVRHRLTSNKLRVSNVGPQDEGLYQCMVENGVGSAQAFARLITVSTGE